MIRNCGTPADATLGRELARLIDEAEPRARLIVPAIPPRCASSVVCAGSHTPNGVEAPRGGLERRSRASERSGSVARAALDETQTAQRRHLGAEARRSDFLKSSVDCDRYGVPQLDGR